jgi:signal transduction histidine kinase
MASPRGTGWSPRRSFSFAELVLTSIEMVAILAPASLAVPAAVRAQFVIAGVAFGLMLAPLSRLLTSLWLRPATIGLHRRQAGAVLSEEERETCRRALLALPQRVFQLRAALWPAGALVAGVVMHLDGRLPRERIGTLLVIAALHAFLIGLFRVLWYARLLRPWWEAILPDLEPLRRFADRYHERLFLAAFSTSALAIAGVAAFTAFFIPINLEQYLGLQTYYPLTLLLIAIMWVGIGKRFTADVDAYLEVALDPDRNKHPLRDDPRATSAFRAAQSLPYAFAVVKAGVGLVGLVLLGLQMILFFEVDVENAALLVGEALAVTICAAVYEALWHRSTMRPFLQHLSARHRPNPDAVGTPLSLRGKMLVGFGAVSLFAGVLGLFWSFMQFKTLATDFIQREGELRLSALLGDLRDRAREVERAGGTYDEDMLVARLTEIAHAPVPRGSIQDEVVFYLLPADPARAPIAIGGARRPPDLPGPTLLALRRLDHGTMELTGQQLTGAYGRLRVMLSDGKRSRELGTIALLLPGYRSRGPSTVPQLRVLICFFLALLGASIGVVFLLARDLTRPIRDLERRAEAMAKGDLLHPVSSIAAEADEVGRLIFSFEEMRRALSERLRSSTEINLSLEQEVSRRTAELERRNRELAEALEQLRRAQDQLVRSEKMASMGRLVAGIAHEINNPVNAIVNTVGPLKDALGHGASADEIGDMIRVVQNGANRTKEIVQALHNYSRGDDDRQIDVDLERAIDDSLDLLRHQLRGNITVEKKYGGVGRVRGHAGPLNQVFMNLLSNAAQAIGDSKGQGTIEITTARKADQIEVAIRDDGPGIPPEVLPRIFDPFFTTKDVGKGSGLGLSIVHGIVERHGGRIDVESSAGRGTRFIVTLPSKRN